MELKDFQKPSLLLENYNLEDFHKGVRIPSGSAAQIAATEVLTGEVPEVTNFRSRRESLTTPEGRRAFLMRQEDRRNEILKGLEEEVASIIIDPEITDEQKRTYVDGVRAAPTSYSTSTSEQLMEQAIASPGSASETERQHETRINYVDQLRQVSQSKRAITIALNGVYAERNPDTKQALFDLGELIVPFAEWVDVNGMYQDLVGEDEILMGSQREKLFSVMEKMPYDQRAEFTQKLIEYVNAHDQVIFPDGNDLIALDALTHMVTDEEYSNFEKWFDNAVSVMEATGVLAGLGRFLKIGAIARASAKLVRSEVSPTSPTQLIKEVNPEKARAMHDVAMADETGEAAEALYGTTREEAAAKDILPEPGIEPGEVEVKPQPLYSEPERLRDLRSTDGQTYYTEAEAAAAVDKVVDDLSEVEGMVLNPSETVVRTNNDGSMNISMVYHPQDSGFKTASEALENAKYAFRHYGLEEEHFTLYRRSGDKWIVTTQKLLEARAELRDEFVRTGQEIPDQLKEIDYAVGIDYNYRISPEDIEAYDVLSTNRIFGLLPANILDRMSPGLMTKTGQGSITQNILDANSVLAPQIVRPAAVAVDKGVRIKKAYIDEFEGFVKGWKGLKKDRKAFMTDYIHRANLEGIPFNEVDLYARGFNSDEVQLLREWRRANDYMFHAANADMAKTLINRGYQMFIHSESNTRLVVKPMKRGSANANQEFYDVATGEVKRAGSKQELDELYEAGGTYAQLSEPVQVGEDWIDIVKVDGTRDTGYLRRIKDDERVLNYRDGYYPVMYDANFFVYRTITKADGTTFEKVVASARNRQDADREVERLRQLHPNEEIGHRPDRRADSERATSFDEMGWSLGVNTGLSSQRVRGERLGDASSNLHNSGMSNLVDPLEAVANQIQQLSSRVAMRNYLDAVKARWVDNYAEPLKLERDRTGNYRFPASVEAIRKNSDIDSQTLADARSMFNYIYSLENGYINGIDEGFKALFNFGADMMANMKWNKAEETLRDWGKGSQTSAAKAAVFKMYLAANPQRQLIIQGHQAVQLTPINPTYVVGPMQWDLYRLGRAMRGYEGDAEAVEMLTELRNSGMLEAVDANNLVRQDMLRLADSTAVQKFGSVLNAPLKLSQKVGFDTAEQFVLVTSWLAHRDLAVKAGRTLDRRAYDEIAGQARAFTYNMNRAGDMPYNRNTLNIIAQFLQVPHKAMLQPITNNTLTAEQRLTLLTWNTAMYGVHPRVLGSWFYDTFEPGEVRDSIEEGLEHVLLNKVLTAVSGEKQSIDWGDLRPTDITGMYEFVHGLFTTDVGKMVANSPSASLIMGSNPRLTDAVKSMTRWVFPWTDYEDPELETRFADVVRSSMSMFSGYSNAFKANYAFKTGTKISSSGNVTDEDVTKIEAAAQFFGFVTETERATWEINSELYGDKTFDAGPGGDVDKWYNELKRQLARKGQNVQEFEVMKRVLSEGGRVFQDDPRKFAERFTRLVEQDIERNEYNIYDKILRQEGWVDNSELLKLVEMLPESEDKAAFREMVKALGEE